jgi:hypothetical protein
MTAPYAPLQACPRWQKCSANICPLDPDWRQRSHGAGDLVCFYLCEAVKPGAAGRFQALPTENMLAKVLRPLPEISARWTRIKAVLNHARTTGSRMDRPQPGRRAA